jgi:cupin 2 domain-containing protein
LTECIAADSLPQIVSERQFVKTGNVFAQLPIDSDREVLDVLATNGDVRVERIVSNAQASPPGFWYDQEQHEWVIVLRGQAGLLFEGEQRPTTLGPGDHVTIPAHTRHRVAWTSSDEPTVWLAVFYG